MSIFESQLCHSFFSISKFLLIPPQVFWLLLGFILNGWCRSFWEWDDWFSSPNMMVIFVRKKTTLDPHSFLSCLFYLFQLFIYSFIEFYTTVFYFLFAFGSVLHTGSYAHIHQHKDGRSLWVSACRGFRCHVTACIIGGIPLVRSVKALSCSTEACSSVVICQCHTCDTHTLLPVDHSLLLPSHLYQGLAFCHNDTWGEKRRRTVTLKAVQAWQTCLLDKHEDKDRQPVPQEWFLPFCSSP